MHDDNYLEALSQATVHDRDGNRIGKVGQLFLDDQTGKPSWVTVQTGLFGTSETFVPLEEYDFDGSEVKVPFDKAFISDAPRIDPEGHLDPADEDKLYAYYGIGANDAAARDHFDPATSHVPAEHRDTDSADWNKTAGLERPDGAVRDSDHTGGLEAPVNPIAQNHPPAAASAPLSPSEPERPRGANPGRTPAQGEGTSGFPGQGASGSSSSLADKLRLRRYGRGRD